MIKGFRNPVYLPIYQMDGGCKRQMLKYGQYTRMVLYARTQNIPASVLCFRITLTDIESFLILGYPILLGKMENRVMK